MRALNYLKKLIVLMIAAGSIMVVSVSNSSADANTFYLYYIWQNTSGILSQLNAFPQYLGGFGQVIQMAISWMKADKSDDTANMQSSFSSIGNLLGANNGGLVNDQKKLTADLFGANVSDFNSIGFGRPAPILTKVNNINDITYQSYEGKPIVERAPNMSEAYYNYIKNASGLGIPHVVPNPNWQGQAADKAKYTGFYNAITAVESFNASVLSELYYRTGSDFNQAQMALINQAGSSSWIKNVATEDLGVVFRQLLMFESQNYVLMSELIKLQKKALAGQVMANGLLIMSNQVTEPLMVSKAQGVQPKM